MNKFRVGALVAGVVVVGGGIFISSTFAGSEKNTTESLMVVRHAPGEQVQRRVIQRAKPEMRATAVAAAERNIELMAPPVELKTVPSPSSEMVVSVQPMAPVARVVNAPPEQSRSSRPAPQRAQYAAKKTRPDTLFTFVRMLNFAPHPLNEELLRHEPLTLGENKYWFSLKYDEDWKVINDDEGYIKGISFEIDVMENNTAVRRLKTPKVAIDAAKIKKGQILGIAEVAPYKFTISVDDFVKTGRGVSELVFKLDLVS